MSHKTPNALSARQTSHAAIFSALGDETRLALLARLCNGKRQSISQLTAGTKLTRQAITKHLRVLETAGIVHGVRAGRKSLFEFNPRPIKDIAEYLELVSQRWDRALSRLKSFVEK